MRRYTSFVLLVLGLVCGYSVAGMRQSNVSVAAGYGAANSSRDEEASLSLMSDDLAQRRIASRPVQFVLHNRSSHPIYVCNGLFITGVLVEFLDASGRVLSNAGSREGKPAVWDRRDYWLVKLAPNESYGAQTNLDLQQEFYRSVPTSSRSRVNALRVSIGVSYPTHDKAGPIVWAVEPFAGSVESPAYEVSPP